jgi:hypothetical protein
MQTTDLKEDLQVLWRERLRKLLRFGERNMSNMQEGQEINELLENPLWKKILIAITGTLLLALIISYFLVSFPIYSILESKYESVEIIENVITLDKFLIIFEDDTYTQLKELYSENLEAETSVCLKGTKSQDYFISEIYEPDIIEQSYSHVSFRPCSEGTIIVLHTHPYKRCIASRQDLKMLKGLKERNEDALIMIMCEPTRFTIYGHK